MLTALRTGGAALLLAAGLTCIAACGPAPGAAPAPPAVAREEPAPPAARGALALNWGTLGETLDGGETHDGGTLGAADGELLISWLEPAGDEGDAGHRLRFARLGDDGWSEPATIVSGPGFFANWADFPSLARSADGSLLAHWLERNGDGTYAYGVELARSTDGGRTWQRLGSLHEDASPTEHGFVSLLPEGDGVRAFWLDGRAMAAGGAMALRTARVTADGIGGEEVLDERVCECCQTGAALAEGGPLVVYRDRSAEEVRDVAVVRRRGEEWSPPHSVHDDGWRIPGCPVNGPMAAVTDGRLAVAWFTGVRPRPRVQVSFSDDGGASFGSPVEIEAERPLGRVGLVADGEGGVAVSWLAYLGDESGEDGESGDRAGNRGAVQVRRVTADGRLGEVVTVAATSAARHSGFPRLAVRGDRLYLAWLDVADDRAAARIRVHSLPLDSLPRP